MYPLNFQKIVHYMDSRKTQRAQLPGKSIFKDTALGIEYRETQQKLIKRAEFINRNDAIIP